MSTVLKALRSCGYFFAFLGVLVGLMFAWPLTFVHPILRSRLFQWPQSRLPGNLIIRTAARFLLFVGGTRVRINREASDPEGIAVLGSGPCLVMYTHASNLDPVIITAVAGCCPKQVYKKELGYLPLFGWVLWMYGHVAIDRKNRGKAIEALSAAVKRASRLGKSLAVAPEGTRSKTGELQEFKRGPFHMAVQSGMPSVPVVIRGAHQLLPPKSLLLSAGEVELVVLKPVSAKDCEVDSIQQIVYDSVSAAVAEGKRRDARNEAAANTRRAELNNGFRGWFASLPAIGTVTTVICGMYHTCVAAKA